MNPLIPLRPIRNDGDHEAALTAIEMLWNAEPGSAEEASLEVLSILVDRFEEGRWPISPPSALEAIRFRMQQSGYGQSDLADLLNSRSKASEILNEKRTLSLADIRALHAEWNIPADCLIL